MGESERKLATSNLKTKDIARQRLHSLFEGCFVN